MPLLSIYLPTKFIHDYSELARVMVSNEDKLVTPYDVHMTLKDIIDVWVKQVFFVIGLVDS